MSAKDYSRLAALIRRILVPAPWAATALRSPAPATVSGFFLLENIPNPSILTGMLNEQEHSRPKGEPRPGKRKPPNDDLISGAVSPCLAL